MKPLTPAHLLTNSLTHSRTYSLTYLLTYSLLKVAAKLARDRYGVHVFGAAFGASDLPRKEAFLQARPSQVYSSHSEAIVKPWEDCHS
jgi:hypothetical protein